VNTCEYIGGKNNKHVWTFVFAKLVEYSSVNETKWKSDKRKAIYNAINMYKYTITVIYNPVK
jgi:hypothetical protein